MRKVTRLLVFFLSLGFLMGLCYSSSPAQISPAERFVALRQMVQSGADHGAFFVPDTEFGFSIFRFLDNSQIEICTFTSTATDDVSPIGPNQIDMHHDELHGPALAEYTRVDSDFNVLEYLSGPGKFHAHGQGIVDAFLLPAGTFYFTGRPIATHVDGKGKVGPVGDPHPDRHLRCGYKVHADGSHFRFWFELQDEH